MKTYKTITTFVMDVMYIEHFNTLEAAEANFEKAIQNEAEAVYLIEEELHWSGSGDSENIILKKHFNN